MGRGQATGGEVGQVTGRRDQGIRSIGSRATTDIALNDGDAEATLARPSVKLIEAGYEFPYLAHAPMEPLNAVVRFDDGILEIWSGHQFPTVYQQTGAKLMGIAADKVKLHVLMSGGSFGSRRRISFSEKNPLLSFPASER